MKTERLLTAFSELTELVARLRGTNGCPWDAQQTDTTIKMYLLEEAYEVLDAIENGSPRDVCQELGDLLFQIIFLSSMAQDRGEFDLLDVLENITEKMINRHPHVFGSVKVENKQDVSDNWESIKRAEKGSQKKISDLLDGVPINMPALQRSHRLGQRAAKAGFESETSREILKKIKEEFKNLEECIQLNDKDGLSEETGDLFFNLVSLTRHCGLNSENLLREANRKFIKHIREAEDNK